jgi:hypothetical protein
VSVQLVSGIRVDQMFGGMQWPQEEIAVERIKMDCQAKRGQSSAEMCPVVPDSLRLWGEDFGESGLS